MKFILSFFFLFLFVNLSAQNDEAELEKRLFDLPGVQFKKLSKPNDKTLKYLLTIRQPLDHEHPENGSFYQAAVLTHKDFKKPLVMETEGYELHYGGNEIEKMLKANNVNIEHRYFGSSKPDSLQLDYLTCEQVTADLHHINQLLRTIYKGKYVSTGISRGGQVSIYYKTMYPADVDLTIPYVAGLPNSLEDRRIYHFLDTMGSPECRAKIYAVQKFLLDHKAEAMNKLKWYAKGSKLTFEYVGGIGKAFELNVLEYPFAFWQISSVPCEKIPINKSVDDYLDHLLAIGALDFFSDKSIKEWMPNGYMAKTQMGFYGYELTRFKNDLQFIKGENPSAAFVPAGVQVKLFDSRFISKVDAWLEEHGNNLLYIYGSRDTWSACRVQPSPKTNAKSYLIQGANHFEARVKNMPEEMRRDFAATVKQMLGIAPDLALLK